jgi:hypothetical protein
LSSSVTTTLGSSGYSRRELRDQFGFGTSTASARDDGRARVDPSAIQRFDDGADAFGTHRGGERLGAERAQQRERGRNRSDAAERVEAGECTQQLRLGPVVGVEAASMSVEGLLAIRVRLQRQGPSGGEHLEQIRQVAGDIGEWPIVDHRRPVRVGAEPQLGPRPTVGGGVQ